MLAGEERRLGRAEKSDRRSDFGRMREPADADHPPRGHPRHFRKKLEVGPAGLAEARRRQVAGAIGLGLDRPRGDAVDGDAMAHDFAGESDGETNYGAFANAGEQV
jgi:hypothetical protein